MKNKSLQDFDDKIDLLNILIELWHDKFKVLLIVIISFFLGLGYTSTIQNNYSHLLMINQIDNAHFTKLKYLKSSMAALNNKGIINKQENEKLLNEIMLKRFVDELTDYDEFLLSLKNTKKMRKKFSNIAKVKQERELFKYANLLEVIYSENEWDKSVSLKLKWDDTAEAYKILKDTLDLTINNLEKSIIRELEQSLELLKKNKLYEDSIRLDYLIEQKSIAQELKIADNQIGNNDLYQLSRTYTSIFNFRDGPDYLRGYVAINKEIEIIENRAYKNFKFIEKELDDLRNEGIKLVKYNVNFTSSKSLKQDTNKILVISILLGLIVAVFVVIISNAIKFKFSQKKTN